MKTFRKTYPMGQYPLLQSDLDEIRNEASSIAKLVIKPIKKRDREVWLLEVDYEQKRNL